MTKSQLHRQVDARRDLTDETKRAAHAFINSEPPGAAERVIAGLEPEVPAVSVVADISLDAIWEDDERKARFEESDDGPKPEPLGEYWGRDINDE